MGTTAFVGAELESNSRERKFEERSVLLHVSTTESSVRANLAKIGPHKPRGGADSDSALHVQSGVRGRAEMGETEIRAAEFTRGK